MPALSAVFLGVNHSGPTTLITAGFSPKENGCAGVGRDIHDCPTNSVYFADTGFHKDFRDGHNQPYHVWGYIANSSSSNLYGSFGGVLIGVAGNYFHEGVQGVIRYPENGWGTSWEDYTLSYKGMFIGVMVSTDMIPPAELGSFVLQFLGPDGSGSNGFTGFYQNIFGSLPGSPE